MEYLAVWRTDDKNHQLEYILKGDVVGSFFCYTHWCIINDDDYEHTFYCARRDGPIEVPLANLLVLDEII